MKRIQPDRKLGTEQRTVKETGFVATKHLNYKTKHGKLAKGCEQCVKGEKLVLFVTGICGNGCTYCPVSDQKNCHDVMYANEWQIQKEEDLLTEARLMNAKGAGITGGDPLAVMKRTCDFIRLLKKTKGKNFHIHLYTPLLRVNKKNLQELYEAGLDEIRFHPRLDDDAVWERLLLAKVHDWGIGIEVPLIPEQEAGLKKLIMYVAEYKIASFINFNEFEYADNEVFEKNKGTHKVEPKNRSSYAVKGSLELGQRLLTLCEEKGLTGHLCTAQSKDAVQLAERLKRRAKGSAKIYDAVDEEGLLTRGALYLGISITEEGYQQKVLILPKKEKEKVLEQLKVLKILLLEEWDVPEELLEIDEERLRLLTTTSVAEAVAENNNEIVDFLRSRLSESKDINMTVALVKEYPTHDCLLVEADILCKRG